MYELAASFVEAPPKSKPITASKVDFAKLILVKSEF